MTTAGEKTLTRSSPGYQITLVLLLSLNFGILFFDRNALNFLMPFVQPELKLSFTQVGLLSSALSLSWALSGFLIGMWSDRVGRKKIFVVGAGLIFSLCSFMSGIAGRFLTLLAARLVMGAAEGAVMPISHSLAADEVTPERRGLAMGVVQNLGSCFLGAFLAPVLLPVFAAAVGWRHAFFIAGAPGLLLAALIWLFVHDSLPAQAASRHERLTLREAFRHKNMTLCVSIAILLVSFFVITLTFMPLYLTKISKLPAQTAGWLIGVLGISATLGSFVIPAISDFIGRRPVMIAVPFASLVLPLGVMYLAPSLWVLTPIFFIGWAINSIFPMFMATIPSETLPPKYVATATGIVMGLAEVIGGVCSPFLAGWASDLAGLNAVTWILTALTVLAGVLAMFLDETAPRKRQLSIRT